MRIIPLNGLYPTHPLLNFSWLFIGLFELAICCLEIGLIDWYLCRKYKLDDTITKSLTFIVFLSNMVTLALGIFLQMLMTGI